MSCLEISLLGSFRVTLSGEPVNRFGTDAARALLAYLALRARTRCRRETLAGLLWPDQPEAEARHNLRQTLTRLRKAIGDRDTGVAIPFLHVTRKDIQLNPESDHWLDVRAFEALIAACKGHRHRRLDACRSCVRRLREAVDLYRGDLMAGFTFPSALLEAWLVTERERLHRQALDALHHLATYHERHGKHEQVQGCAQRQLALEPWREGAHRQLMRALALSRQRGAALAQYETCCRALEEELGVEPETETRRLYERIRDGQLDDLSRVPPHNLPSPLTPFVGREREMAEVEECLQNPDCRLLTLVGPGGIGKTRLAIEAAVTQVGAFSYGVHFCSLAPLQSVDAIVPTVARALGFSFSEEGKPRQQLLDHLRHKSMLLVLDNYEHLLDRSHPARQSGAGLVVDILRAAQDVTILTTSRERLNVQGEHLFPVGGMDYPVAQAGSDPSQIGQQEQYSGVKLFLRSAQRVRPGFEPAADDWAHIARICRMVQGMPLGILLAAPWIQMLSPAEIAAQIGRSINFLETDLHDVPARQRSIRAVFDHSWDLLTEREQGVFHGVSVFRGGFTHGAAQAVTGATLRELMALVNKSLLHHAHAGRYEMHELLRQYAAGKLAQDPDASTMARDRHCAFFVAALQRWGADLKGPGQQAALAEMGADIDNARAAWNWAVERGRVECLDQVLEGLCRFYEWRGRYQEGEAICKAAAEGLEVMACGDTPALLAAERLRVRARILAWESAFGERLGSTELASQLLQQSLALLEEHPAADQDTRLEKAFALRQMGRIASDVDREQAKRLCGQSLALYQALGDSWEVAGALHALGQRAENLGAYQEAEQWITESLALRQSLRDQRGIAESLLELAGIAWRRGQFEEAGRLFRENVAICREIGDRSGIVTGLHQLALTVFCLGEYVQARSELEACLAIYTDRGVRASIAHSNTHLGMAKMGLGQYEPAGTHGQTALALCREIGFQRGTSNALFALGQVALAKGAYTESRDLLQESVTICREIGHRHDLSAVFSLLGMAECGMGNLCQAQQYVCEGLRTAAETRAFLPSILVLPAIALLLVQQGQQERAVELYALASRHPFVANSRWFEDIAGRHVAAVAATLPPELAEAAQERGRARDLEATVAELSAELGG